MEKIIDDAKDSLSCINDNKYIIGITMIMLNIGARFIIDELDDDLRAMISNTYVRRVVVFCSFFMATKDLFTATVLTIIFVIFINEVFAKELDGIDEKDDDDKGDQVKSGKANKNELEKTIQNLQMIQMNM
jgi:hypothetical protein|tara:strand:+ start:54 stop:446 length:393 start_codon:yes stop_codon:yes gene_type:complete